MEFKGKTAIIAGSAQGIGAHRVPGVEALFLGRASEEKRSGDAASV
jgi:hypothetical protein